MQAEDKNRTRSTNIKRRQRIKPITLVLGLMIELARTKISRRFIGTFSEEDTAVVSINDLLPISQEAKVKKNAVYKIVDEPSKYHKIMPIGEIYLNDDFENCKEIKIIGRDAKTEVYRMIAICKENWFMLAEFRIVNKKIENFKKLRFLEYKEMKTCYDFHYDPKFKYTAVCSDGKDEFLKYHLVVLSKDFEPEQKYLLQLEATDHKFTYRPCLRLLKTPTNQVGVYEWTMALFNKPGNSVQLDQGGKQSVNEHVFLIGISHGKISGIKKISMKTGSLSNLILLSDLGVFEDGELMVKAYTSERKKKMVYGCKIKHQELGVEDCRVVNLGLENALEYGDMEFMYEILKFVSFESIQGVVKVCDFGKNHLTGIGKYNPTLQILNGCVTKKIAKIPGVTFSGFERSMNKNGRWNGMVLKFENSEEMELKLAVGLVLDISPIKLISQIRLSQVTSVAFLEEEYFVVPGKTSLKFFNSDREYSASFTMKNVKPGIQKFKIEALDIETGKSLELKKEYSYRRIDSVYSYLELEKKNIYNISAFLDTPYRMRISRDAIEGNGLKFYLKSTDNANLRDINKVEITSESLSKYNMVRIFDNAMIGISTNTNTITFFSCQKEFKRQKNEYKCTKKKDAILGIYNLTNIKIQRFEDNGYLIAGSKSTTAEETRVHVLTINNDVWEHTTQLFKGLMRSFASRFNSGHLQYFMIMDFPKDGKVELKVGRIADVGLNFKRNAYFRDIAISEWDRRGEKMCLKDLSFDYLDQRILKVLSHCGEKANDERKIFRIGVKGIDNFEYLGFDLVPRLTSEERGVHKKIGDETAETFCNFDQINLLHYPKIKKIKVFHSKFDNFKICLHYNELGLVDIKNVNCLRRSGYLAISGDTKNGKFSTFLYKIDNLYRADKRVHSILTESDDIENFYVDDSKDSLVYSYKIKQKGVFERFEVDLDGPWVHFDLEKLNQTGNVELSVSTQNGKESIIKPHIDVRKEKYGFKPVIKNVNSPPIEQLAAQSLVNIEKYAQIEGPVFKLTAPDDSKYKILGRSQEVFSYNVSDFVVDKTLQWNFHHYRTIRSKKINGSLEISILLFTNNYNLQSHFLMIPNVTKKNQKMAHFQIPDTICFDFDFSIFDNGDTLDIAILRSCGHVNDNRVYLDQIRVKKQGFEILGKEIKDDAITGIARVKELRLFETLENKKDRIKDRSYIAFISIDGDEGVWTVTIKRSLFGDRFMFYPRGYVKEAGDKFVVEKQESGDNLVVFYLGDDRRRVAYDVFDLKNLQYRAQNISISSDFFKFQILDFNCKFNQDHFECLFYPNSRVFVIMKIKISGKNSTKIGHETFERYLDFDPVKLEFNQDMVAIESKSSFSKKRHLLIYRRNPANSTKRITASTNNTMNYLYTSLENFEKFDLKNSKIILIRKSGSAQNPSPQISSHEVKRAQLLLKNGRKDIENGYLNAEVLGQKSVPFKIEAILGLKVSGKVDTEGGNFLAHALNIFALLILLSILILAGYYCLKKRALRRLVEESMRNEEKLDPDSSVTDMII